MSIKKTIVCDVCGTEEAEQVTDGGFIGWGALHGIELNGVPNPNLCPTCLLATAAFVDKLGE